MKKIILLMVSLLLFSCTSSPKIKEADKKESSTDSAVNETEKTTYEDAESVNKQDGAPTYLFSENDRSKSFKKLGAGNGPYKTEKVETIKKPNNKTKTKADTPDEHKKTAPEQDNERENKKKYEQKKPKSESSISADKNNTLLSKKPEISSDKMSDKTKKHSAFDEIILFDDAEKPILEKENRPIKKTNAQDRKDLAPKPKTSEKTEQKTDITLSDKNKGSAKIKNKGSSLGNIIIFDEKEKTLALAKDTDADTKKQQNPKVGTESKTKRSNNQENKHPIVAEKADQQKKSDKTNKSNTRLNNDGARVAEKSKTKSIEAQNDIKQKKPEQAINVQKNDAIIAKSEKTQEAWPKKERDIPSDTEVLKANEQAREKHEDGDETKKEYFTEFPTVAEKELDVLAASRSIAINQNQRLKVMYPGEKWVFLGEQTSQKGLNYEQRKFQSGNTEFTFNAKKLGNYILNFSRYDAYSNSFIKDALEVHVGESVSNAPAYVQAPEYILPADIDKKKDTLTPIAKSNSKTNPVLPNQVLNADLSSKKKESVNVDSSIDLLERAKIEIARGDAKAAISDLNQFLKISNERLDEAYFYLGQAYEINGSEKNIKEAFQAYKTVTNSFADSNFWQKSDERIRYIRRFFIDIE